MAYTINKTDGSIFAVVGDGTINTDGSLVIVGKNYSGYGEFQNENFIRLLENGANNTAPTTPILGELWYDKSSNILKVWNGDMFRSLGGAIADGTAPAGNNDGDFWWDTGSRQLKVWSVGANSFITVGPASTSAMGVTGSVPLAVTDTTNAEQVVVELRAGGALVGVVSASTFTPQTVPPGWGDLPSLITPGIVLRNTFTVNGTATDALKLGGFAHGEFVRTTVTGTQTIASALNVTSADGLGVGTNAALQLRLSGAVGRVMTTQTTDSLALATSGVNRLTITPNGNITLTGTLTAQGAVAAQSFSGSGANLTNLNASTLTTGTIPDGRLTGSYTGLINLDGSGTATFGQFSGGGASLTNLNADNLESGAIPNGRLTGSYTGLGHVSPATNNSHNLGTSDFRWSTVFATTFNGTATTALYADLAEKFVPDQDYAPGTLVEIGGDNEITMCVDDACENVFGVVSTDPAYLMNAGAAGVPVALTGRVPVRVVGDVNKGDRLVSAGNGCARAAKREEWTAFNIIGRALESKIGKEEGLLEAVVSVK